MSIQGKIPKLMRSSPFWTDLATAVNEELVLLRSELISPQKTFFEPRTLTTFDDLRSFLQDYYGFSPYTELFYQKTLPVLSTGPFSSVKTSYQNQGWRGHVQYGGNGVWDYITAPAGFTQAIGGTLRFIDASTYLSFPANIPLSVRRGSVLFNFTPTSTATTKFCVIRNSAIAGKGYLGVQTTGIVFQPDDGTAEVSIPFLSTLAYDATHNIGTPYRIGVRFRQGVVALWLNGVYQGSATPAFSGTGLFNPNTVSKGPTSLTSTTAMAGDFGNLKIFFESLSDEDFALEYSGADLNDPTVRLNQVDPLKLIRHEAEGLGYRVRNRGNRLYYEWAVNKARMEAKVYPLFRDPGSNILLKSLIVPKADRVSALDNSALDGYFADGDAFALKWKLDDGWTLDTGVLLDENFLGKNVAFTRHFALELILGQTRDDYGASGFARFTDHARDTQALFLQKHLDYLTHEAVYGKSTVEIPHVGVQLRMSCKRTDTVARMDPSTRWNSKFQIAFPGSSVNWINATYVGDLYTTLEVWSGATLLYSRPILPNEIEIKPTFHLINAMVPALTIFPTTLGPGNGSATTFTGTTLLSRTPVLPGTVLVEYTDLNAIARQMRDDGYGNLYFTDVVPDANHYSGTINYSTGTITVLTLVTGQLVSRALANALNLNITYKTGANLPITKIKIKNSVGTDFLVFDSYDAVNAVQEPSINFWNPANHLSLVATVDLT